MLQQITTPRLQLIALDSIHLEYWLESREKLEDSLQLIPNPMLIDPEFWKEIEDALPMWIEMTKKYPDEYAWFTNWEIILTKENRSVGGIGLFKEESGKIMTGYYIDKKFQRMGFASEALRALLGWAFSNPEVDSIYADTPIELISSQKVLTQNGFIEIDRGEDLIHWVVSRNL